MLQQLSQGIAARLHGTAVHGKRGWKREIRVLLKYQTEDGAANVVVQVLTVLSIMILIRIHADPSMTV